MVKLEYGFKFRNDVHVLLMCSNQGQDCRVAVSTLFREFKQLLITRNLDSCFKAYSKFHRKQSRSLFQKAKVCAVPWDDSLILHNSENHKGHKHRARARPSEAGWVTHLLFP